MDPVIHTEDLELAQRLIQKDEQVTREFFFKKCFPLFKSFYDNYYTDCESYWEFINEMYSVVLVPSKKTGRCQMENYRGDSSLLNWLKSACLYHCFGKYRKKNRIPIITKTDSAIKDSEGDSIQHKEHSINPVLESLDRADAEYIISQMTNSRYQMIMRLRYLHHYSNSDTAKILGMTKANYYNKHRLAKAQFILALEKEERHGKR